MSLGLISAPRVGFEPTTLRLRLSQSFERGRTISSTRKRVVGRWWGLIGLVPQPLVSARSRLHWLLLHPDHSAGFAQDYRFPKELGFPEFTRLFDHSRLWKLQHSCMQFTVTIRTQQDTFVELSSHASPASSVPRTRYAKILFRRVDMMKLQSFITSIIAAGIAPAAQVGECLGSHRATPLGDGPNEIFASVLVCTFVSQSKNYRQWLTAACSAIELPRSSRSEKYPEQLKVPTVHGSFQFD